MKTHFLTEEEIRDPFNGLPHFTTKENPKEKKTVPIGYFRSVAGHEFEEDILHEWLKAHYPNEVKEHLLYVPRSTKNMLHLALQAFFDELSPAWIEVFGFKQREKSNVIIIGEKSDANPTGDDYTLATFYLHEVAGRIVDVDSARHAFTFDPGSEFETETLEFLRNNFPTKVFSLLPWTEAFDATTHLD